MNYQTYCKQLLEDKNIQSILQNKSHEINQNGMFPICQGNLVPEFFNNNLVSPNRIIKYLQGQYCILRAFYFQLFKLMFQIQIENKDYLEIFKQFVFDPNLLKDSNDPTKRRSLKSSGRNSRVSKMSNDSQDKNMTINSQFQQQFKLHQKCLLEFIQKVTINQPQYESFQDFLKQYPQVDQSMIIILQTFVQNCDSQQNQMDSVQSILQYFAQIFQISLVVFQNCFKFQESDVFLFVDEKQDEEMWIYIAYNQIIDQEDDEDDEDDDEDNQQRDVNNIQEVQQVQEERSHIISSNHTAKVMNSQMQEGEIKIDGLLKKYDLNDQHRNNRIVSEALSSINKLQNNQKLDQFGKQLSKSIQFQKNVSFLPKNTSQIFGVPKPITTSFHQIIGQDQYSYNPFNKKSGNNSNYFESQAVKKDQSITQPYQQRKFVNLEQDIRTSQSIEGSFQVIEKPNSKFQSDFLNETQKIGESRTQTIINMFGDMLSSGLRNNEHSLSTNKLPIDSANKIQQDKPKSRTSRQTEDNIYDKVNMMKKNTSENVILQAKPIGKQSTIIRESVENVYNEMVTNVIPRTFEKSSTMVRKQAAESIFNQIVTNVLPTNNEPLDYGGYLIDSQKLRQQQILHKSQQFTNNQRDVSSNRQKGYSYHSVQRSNQKSQCSRGSYPEININNVPSLKSQSSNGKNKRNYFYSDEDYMNIQNNRQSIDNIRAKQQSYEKKSNSNNSHHSNKSYKQLSIQQKNQEIKGIQGNYLQKYKNQQQTTQIYEQNKNKYSYSKDYIPISKNVNHKSNIQTKIQKSHQNEQQDFFYRPIGTTKPFNKIAYNDQSKLGTIVQMGASKQTVKQSLTGEVKSSFSKDQSNFVSKYAIPHQKQDQVKLSAEIKMQKQKQLLRSNNRMKKYQSRVKDFLNEGSINQNNGTFYRQFTNTKILKLIKQPYRTKVQILKHRFKGQNQFSNPIL